MQLQLISPEKILFSGEVAMVTAPGSEGEFGVLNGHAPLVSTLKPGIVTIDLPHGAQQKIAVLSGIAEVSPERMTLLVESAADCSAVSAAQAQSRLQAARQACDDAITDEQKKAAQAELAMAEVLAANL